MFGRILPMLRLVAGSAVVFFGLVTLASAQVPPNPPTGVSIDDGTSEPPPDPGTPGNPVFFDDFGYVVNKTDSADTKRARFQAAGWAGVKDEQTQPGRAFGYLSTTTTIPGYSGRIPGRSGRALRMEGLPTTMGDFSSEPFRNQTDFYLVYGNSAGPQTNVPGNVWFQFWVYINDYGSERSHWSSRNKLIYPSDDGTARGDGTENAYMLHIRPSNQAGVVQPYGPNASAVTHIEGSSIVSNAPEGVGRLGHNRTTSGHQTPNGWYLHKVHFDHSQVNGVYEHWIRPMGGEWRKTSEWISGVTPGFTWITHAHERPGHNLFKLGTTWGTANFDDRTDYDAWLYLADFAIARNEADLPTYDNY